MAFVHSLCMFLCLALPAATFFPEPRITWPATEVSLTHFKAQGVYNYSTLLLSEDKDVLYIGAREAIFAVNSLNISEKKHEAYWKATEEKSNECVRKGKSKQTECLNYIRVLQPFNENSLYVCGTNAFHPSCDLLELDSFQLVGKNDDGKGRCPFDPAQSYTSVMVVNIYLRMLCLLRMQRRRRYWTHPLVGVRDSKGQFWSLYNDIRSHRDKFFEYTRMSIESFDTLLQIMTPHLQRQDTVLRKSISPTERLIVTLRCLGTGQSYTALYFQFRLGRSTIYNIVLNTCKALWSVLKDQVFRVPSEEKWTEIASQFWERCNFPNCLGAIDGKHIRIVMPPFSGSKFFNYKKYFSIVLLAVADADYRFIYVDVGAYGSSSDSAIFRQSRLCKLMREDKLKIPRNRPWPGTNGPAYPFTFIGDEAFGIGQHMLRPYSQRGLNYNKRIFNYRISRARRMVECTFGILANKWRILHQSIVMQPQNATNVIKACCVLHNYVRERDGIHLEEVDSIQHNMDPAHWTGGRIATSALAVRDAMADYFVTEEGKIPWQDQYI